MEKFCTAFNPNQAWLFSSLYLNQLCLSAVLLWLQEDFAPQAKLWTTTTGLPSFEKLVNESALLLGQ
ncbi:DUF1822 family protein [Fischerella thermalis]|uniref:DUF1822 family protein n=1 Tax=Fischerella thermalis TaxID=372787 RepID=UPI002155DE1C|nr:DUF1822 family protein [Fischerella thermalis]